MIVVLVILAILAAIMIPQLVGYIDKAKEKQYMLDARNVQIAAQTILNEKYATEKKGAGNYEIKEEDKTAILKLAELDGVVTISTLKTAEDSYKIIGMTIVDGGKTLTFNGSKWSMS